MTSYHQQEGKKFYVFCYQETPCQIQTFIWKKKKKKSISEMSLLFLKYSSGINTLFTTDTIVDFLPRDAARKPEVFIYGYTLQI